MNKTELIAAAAKRCGMPQKDIWRALTGILPVIEEEVAVGGFVQIIGFGTFERRFRSERKGRNPQTGEEVTISERWAPAFSAGKHFTEMVMKPKRKRGALCLENAFTVKPKGRKRK